MSTEEAHFTHESIVELLKTLEGSLGALRSTNPAAYHSVLTEATTLLKELIA